MTVTSDRRAVGRRPSVSPREPIAYRLFLREEKLHTHAFTPEAS
jgi:hypothetical protein